MIIVVLHNKLRLAVQTDGSMTKTPSSPTGQQTNLENKRIVNRTHLKLIEAFGWAERQEIFMRSSRSRGAG